MKKMICFDMDGTVADLYNVNDWLPKLRNENPSPYSDAAPMWDMEKLRTVLLNLMVLGWEIRIISWLSKNSSESYKKATREAKLSWLNKYQFPYNKAHLVQYGTTKADCVRQVVDYAILIDDNQKVRNGWHLGKTIDPTNCDLIATLEALAREE